MGQLTKRTFDVVITTPPPFISWDRAWEKMWQTWHWQSGDNFIVTHGDVREDGIHARIEYTVCGGAPSDLRKRIGSLLFGRRVSPEEVRVTQVSAEKVTGYQ